MELRHNPFYILGASIADSKRRIMELAEEKSLFGNEEAVEEAKTILLDPIRRIDAELSWFPELDVETALAMALHLVEGATMPSCRLNGMARITGKAELMSRTQYDALSNKDVFANDILMLSRAFRYLDNDALLDLLNQKRRRSGFPEILDDYLFADKIDNRQKEVLGIIHHCMDSISIEILLQTFYRIAEQDTEDGNIQASILVEDIVCSYENNMMTQEFMENEAVAIHQLMEAIGTANDDDRQSPKYVLNLITSLAEALKQWNKVVTPIQILAVSHGKEHTLSANLLNDIRSLAIDLNNDFNRPELSLEVLATIEKTNADKYISSFNKVRDEDVKTLNDIIHKKENERNQEREKRRQDEKRKIEQEKQRKFERSILYETKIGLLFKDIFRISIDGITWKEQFFPLNQIKSIRWGVSVKTIKHRTSTIYRSHTFVVGFKSSHSEVEINPNDNTQYREIVDRLWKTVGVTLMISRLEKMKNGGKYNVGTMVIYDDGVELENYNFFGPNDRKYFKWGDISVRSENGSFVISSKDGEYSGTSSYIDDYNTHVWEALVRNMLQLCNPNNRRLSNLLNMK